MSDDIKNFREAVAKFDELKLELEVLKEGLETNFENYKNVSDISIEVADKNQGVLQSINTLQINAENSVNDVIEKAEILKAQMAQYYSTEYKKTKQNLDTLLTDIDSSIGSLKNSINTDIQTAINSINIDTSKLTSIIDKKVDSIDLSPLEDYTKSVNIYLKKHKEDAVNNAKEIKKIRTEIEIDKEELDKEFKEYYQNKKEWISKLKSQNNRYTKSFKTPRGFIIMMLLAIFFGLGTGAIITKYLTNKQVIVYQKLDIPKLAQKSGEKDWVSTKVLEAEMKNKTTDVNILAFIPWWIILIFAFMALVIFSPVEEKKDEWYH